MGVNFDTKQSERTAKIYESSTKAIPSGNHSLASFETPYMAHPVKAVVEADPPGCVPVAEVRQIIRMAKVMRPYGEA